MVFRPSSARGSAILPELQTARLTLRRLHPGDAPFITRLLNDPAFLANIGDRGVRNDADARRYIENGPVAMYQRHGFGLWHVARRTDGASVGLCGLLKRDTLPEVDLGYAFLPEFRGQGLAFEAAAATLRAASGKYGLERVIAVVSPENTASVRVLEKLGMHFERRHVMDPGQPEVCVYGRTLSGT